MGARVAGVDGAEVRVGRGGGGAGRRRLSRNRGRRAGGRASGGIVGAASGRLVWSWWFGPSFAVPGLEPGALKRRPAPEPQLPRRVAFDGDNNGNKQLTKAGVF